MMTEMAAPKRLTAVLGPTNTGKTHFALERMTAHRTGMIGFPLRLLARENYDRISRLKGERNVALITGEEKIIPPTARYFVCTVESMPLDRSVDFLAIDEIQLCGDPDRGHIFTDRLLYARGLDETLFLGAETAKPLIRRLVPEADYLSRPRFSSLTYVGPRKITRLPRRTAIVAFSAAEVYALAEVIRRQRGGAAVVLGALSPRTRNAQVEMYQAGEVDYLVATDAIGMGLNMDVDHVAFARLDKFDGKRTRPLTAQEVAQIAGRAGRHMADGTFGTTANAEHIDEQIVERVEHHVFDPIKSFFWRNADLDFRSPEALLASLDAKPSRHELIRVRDAIDHMALQTLSRDPEIMDLARGKAAVHLLWEVCQIPDFRKVMSDAHARLLGQIYRHLRSGKGRLPPDWVREQIDRLDKTEGDIDTLTARLTHVRTWSYVAHRGDWLSDAETWRAKTRSIEDKLSDALHDRLTQRFVDRRMAILTRRLSDGGTLLGAVTKTGDVLVEGHPVARLDGFRLIPLLGGEREETRQLLSAGRKALTAATPRLVRSFVEEPDNAFHLTDLGRLAWRGADVARLLPGDDLLAPRIDVLASDLLSPAQREQVRKRLADFMGNLIDDVLAPLVRARHAVQHDTALSGAARGLVFQLAEGLGAISRATVDEHLALVTPKDRAALRRLGVKLGRESVFLTALVRQKPARLRGILWAVRNSREVPPPPDIQRVTMPLLPSVGAGGDTGMPAEGWFAAVGYRPVSTLAIRIDILERVIERGAELSAEGPFALPPDLLSLTGGGREALAEILLAHGFRRCKALPGSTEAAAEADPTPDRAPLDIVHDAGPYFEMKSNRRPRDGKPGRRSKGKTRRQGALVASDHPFAKLQELSIGKRR